MYIEGKTVLEPDYTPPSTCGQVQCKVDVMKKLLGKKMGKVKTFVKKYKSGPKKFGDVINEDYNFVFSCDSGYQQFKSMCTPCEPGFYSPAKDPACHRCAKDTYQESYGGRRCVKCPYGGKTVLTGATSPSSCIGGSPPKSKARILKMRSKMHGQRRRRPVNKFLKYKKHVLIAIGGIIATLLIVIIIVLVLNTKKASSDGDSKKKKEKKSKSKPKRKKSEAAVAAEAAEATEATEEPQEETPAETEEKTGGLDTNENNSNLIRQPLLRASSSKYDRNNSNASAGLKKGLKPSRSYSRSKYDENSSNAEEIPDFMKQSKPRRSSSHSHHHHHHHRSKRKATSPGVTSSYADFESSKASRRPSTSRAPGRSRSESVTNTSRAAQNAAVNKATHNANISNEDQALDDLIRVQSNLSETTLEPVDSESQSVFQHSRPSSSHQLKSREILLQGKAKYIDTDPMTIIRKMNEKIFKDLSPVHPGTVSSVTPVRSDSSPVYSTPCGEQPLCYVKHADSWYTANWDSAETDETNTLTLSCHTQQSELPPSEYTYSTQSTRGGESWHSYYTET